MLLRDLISELSPIDTKEKIDTLIKKMKENNIKMDLFSDLTIRYSIKKMKLQIYFIDNYSYNRFDENGNKRSTRFDRLLLIAHKRNERKKKRLEKRKEKEKKKNNVQKMTEAEINSLPSIIKTFGKDFQANKKTKKKSNQKKKGQNKNYPIETKNSIHLIYIASGGMNKQY